MHNVLKRQSSVFALAAAVVLGLSASSFAQDGSSTQPDASEPAANMESAAPSVSDDSSSSTQIQGEQPSNQVGEKFELPRYSEDNQVELITGLCGIQMKEMSKPACGCLAEASLDELSDPQRDYLIASVVAPPVSDRMIGDGRVTEADQKEIFAFLQSSSESCKAEFADADAAAPADADSSAPAATETPETSSGNAAEGGSETAN
ncbi:hypothetical protein [Fulvimarina sp. MAC8]|uniref:hypothetical protein n=1 Tax=Fulvimarina sp. MAC8 TaxID=3162874 RepID=UPI0032EBF88E